MSIGKMICRDMDVMIAKNLFGWDGRRETLKQLYVKRGVGQVPYYSTDIAAAWKIIDRLHDLRLIVTVRDDGTANSVLCEIFKPGLPKKEEVSYAHGGTAPRAICRAALKAVQVLREVSDEHSDH